jgi:alpha-beta hydrolase superfamily lysophospholipase
VPLPAYPDAAAAAREEGTVASTGGVRLAWSRFVPPSPRAAVAVLHGGGDHSGRYAGITAALVGAGFAVSLVDFRGHGRSTGRRWHVESFDDYLADLDAFWPRAREAAPGKPAFVVAHSQGALVAALWAIRAPRDAAGLVLSSPYLRLAFTPPRLRVLAARLVGRVVPWLPIATGLRIADLTSDEEFRAFTERDPLYGRKTTPSWFVASMAAQAEVLARAGELRLPLLVLAAGADVIADAGAARAFVEAAGSADKEYRELPGQRHEIWNERERERAIGGAVAWLVARVSREGAKAFDASRG